VLKHHTTKILSVSEAVGRCKKVEKLALRIMPEDKSNKQQNQAAHSCCWQPNQNFSTDLIFRSQQI